MSFEAPAFLAALLVVPLAVALYLRHQRARRGAAAVFASPHTMPSVAPHSPGWRRHAAMAVYGIAAAALAFALARPTATVAVPEEQASVVLAIDRSGSMAATDVSPTRLAAAREAASAFLQDIPARVRAGGVVFDHGVRRTETPDTDRGPMEDLVASLRPTGGTATGDALAAALRMVEAPASVILLSDGASTSGRDPLELAREARRAGVRVHTVALGTAEGTIAVRTRSGAVERRPVPPDRATLEQIAEATGGRAFDAADRDQLGAVYDDLGSRVGSREEERELTGAFAGVAGLLLLGGGFMSLRWFGRLP